MDTILLVRLHFVHYPSVIYDASPLYGATELNLKARLSVEPISFYCCVVAIAISTQLSKIEAKKVYQVLPTVDGQLYTNSTDHVIWQITHYPNRTHSWHMMLTLRNTFNTQYSCIFRSGVELLGLYPALRIADLINGVAVLWCKISGDSTFPGLVFYKWWWSTSRVATVCVYRSFSGGPGNCGHNEV